MIIGLTGSMGCGKGVVVEILEEMGFEYITLSMMVREEARLRGVEEEREKMMEVGNSMRAAEGAGVLAKRALKKIATSDNPNWVVDGIRNPAEIDALREADDVHVFGIETNHEILVERIMERGRESDATERDAILHKIEREWGQGEPEDGQQVGKCMAKVDYTVDNNGTLEEYKENFMNYFNQIKND